MENEQYKLIGHPSSGTSQHVSQLIKDAEKKGIEVVVIGGGVEMHDFIKRNLGEDGVKIVVVDDIDKLLTDKDLSEDFNKIMNPPIPIKNYRANLEPFQEMFISEKNKPKPWESQRRVQKYKKRGGR